MLVSRRGNRFCLITHPEHGRLAGELFARWGNSKFAVPAAREALTIAAIHHDDGWKELDGAPAYDAEQGRPAHFLELPLEVTVPHYGRGVDSVYARNAHAGALVSMHWSGLYRTRWGLQGGGDVHHPLAAQVVAEQERRWIAALGEAWGGRGLRSDFEHQTWHAYEVLQALDFLSLALCLLDLEKPAPEDEPVAMPGTLPRVDQPTGPRSIPGVPLGPGADHAELTLRVSEPGTVAIGPYPFAEPSFEIAVRSRWLEAQRYESAEASARAYHDAAPEDLAITVREA